MGGEFTTYGSADGFVGSSMQSAHDAECFRAGFGVAGTAMAMVTSGRLL